MLETVAYVRCLNRSAARVLPVFLFPDTVGEFMIPELKPRRRFLAAHRSMKWGLYPSDVISAAIAEMDFPPASPIQTAIETLIATRDYGYPVRLGGAAEGAVREAFVARMADRFSWNVDAERVQVATDLVQATTAAILAFTEPGDGVLVQTPCYPPFRDAVEACGRRFVENRLVERDDGFAVDRGSFDSAARDSRLFILCNPHNPTGRVFSESELMEFARICITRDLVVFSDEIHADLLYGAARHIPIASLGGDAAERTITANSASKSFNIPGLRCGVMHFGSDRMVARFRERLPGLVLGRPSVFGVDASVSAWGQCQPWLDAVLAHLGEMRDLVVATIRKEMPGLKVHTPQATYLAWIDCSAMGWVEPAAQRFFDKARVAFSPGETFCPEHQNHVRFNFAASRSTIEEVLERMMGAYRA